MPSAELIAETRSAIKASSAPRSDKSAARFQRWVVLVRGIRLGAPEAAFAIERRSAGRWTPDCDEGESWHS